MIRNTTTMILLSLALLAAGCQPATQGLAPGRGTTRALGDVSYGQAFATAKVVLAQYFPIEEADVNTGVITTRPRAVDAGNDRLLGGSPARQRARMEITRQNGVPFAQVAVTQERQGSAPIREMGYASERRNYSGNPGDVTPAEQGAATTPDQNEAWQIEKQSVPAVEGTILQDLFSKLHAGA
ncbi:MAG: hypothetical protein GVY16_09210 [Planctomycetes bacterium]|jgi:hypothetical protein|nr:hypothetical protein [Planctomycetota bacterium]